MSTNPFVKEIEACLDEDRDLNPEFLNVTVSMKVLAPVLLRLRRIENLLLLHELFEGDTPTPQHFFERQAALRRQLESPLTTEAIRVSIKATLDQLAKFEPMMQAYQVRLNGLEGRA